MLIQKTFNVVAGLAMILALPSAIAQPGPGMQCSACQVAHVTASDLVDAVSDIIGVNPATVTVVSGDRPDRFRVSLPDGTEYVVASDGLVFRHQNMVQRRLLQTEEGGLHLRSQTRTELHLRSALHQETAVVGEMLRLGWTNFFWNRNGMEVESQNGERYCFQPDMQVLMQNPQSGISITQGTDGNLTVIHPDGVQQRLHACAHDFVQLRDLVREQLQQQLMMETDGTFLINIDGVLRRFRLATELRLTNSQGQTELVPTGERLYLRYRDGWEQEVIEIN